MRAQAGSRGKLAGRAERFGIGDGLASLLVVRPWDYDGFLLIVQVVRCRFAPWRKESSIAL